MSENPNRIGTHDFARTEKLFKKIDLPIGSKNMFSIVKTDCLACGKEFIVGDNIYDIICLNFCNKCRETYDLYDLALIAIKKRPSSLKINGRIESYIHSDSLTSNKGGVIVKITCDTDFGAKTEEFIEFCKYTAKLCYAANIWGPVTDYANFLIEIDPEYLTKLQDLEKKLKENINVVEIHKLEL